MTKRAKVSAVVGVRINERELDILKRIQAGVAPCVLSVNGLARFLVQRCHRAKLDKGA